jgi:hypothetical protein
MYLGGEQGGAQATNSRENDKGKQRHERALGFGSWRCLVKDELGLRKFEHCYVKCEVLQSIECRLFISSN